MLFLLGSWVYYSRQLDESRYKRYHPFLQIIPSGQPAVIPKPREVSRIMCLVGSTTVEHKMTGESYPDYPAQLLQQHYPDRHIEVLNAGTFFTVHNTRSFTAYFPSSRSIRI